MPYDKIYVNVDYKTCQFRKKTEDDQDVFFTTLVGVLRGVRQTQKTGVNGSYTQWSFDLFDDPVGPQTLCLNSDFLAYAVLNSVLNLLNSEVDLTVEPITLIVSQNEKGFSKINVYFRKELVYWRYKIADIPNPKGIDKKPLQFDFFSRAAKYIDGKVRPPEAEPSVVNEADDEEPEELPF